jgi:hypothetical protein
LFPLKITSLQHEANVFKTRPLGRGSAYFFVRASGDASVERYVSGRASFITHNQEKVNEVNNSIFDL